MERMSGVDSVTRILRRRSVAVSATPLNHTCGEKKGIQEDECCERRGEEQQEMVVRHASAPRPPDGAGRGEGEDKATTGGIALCGVSRGQLGVRLSASTGRAASRVEEGGGGEGADKTAREEIGRAHV